MILDATASVLASVKNVTTRGASDTARFIAKQAEQGRRRFQSSYALGLAAKGAFEDLYTVAEHCSSPNWDGYGAAPVNQETFRQAYLLLEALPLGIPLPSAGAEPDGHLTLEWHRLPRRTLSVSISPEGELHYAALLGASRAYGTEPFFGEAPEIIVDLIRKVGCS
jgi:hypothetical protein